MDGLFPAFSIETPGGWSTDPDVDFGEDIFIKWRYKAKPYVLGGSGSGFLPDLDTNLRWEYFIDDYGFVHDEEQCRDGLRYVI